MHGSRSCVANGGNTALPSRWTPVAIGVLICLFALWVLGIGGSGGIGIDYSASAGDDGIVGNSIGSIAGLFDYSSWPADAVTARLDVLLHAISRPFVYAHYLIAALVLAASLNDDRRDRSVLFWQSLPVSDLATVTSKLVLAVCIAPLLTVALMTVTWCAVLVMLGVFASAGDAAAAPLAVAGVPSRTLAYLTGYAIQGLWLLPLYALVLLVSAAVTRAPLVWASILPFVPVVLERMFLGTDRLGTWTVNHMKLVALPQPAIASAQGSGPIGFGEQFSLITSVDLWVGVAVGTALLVLAVRMRSRATDL